MQLSNLPCISCFLILSSYVPADHFVDVKEVILRHDDGQDGHLIVDGHMEGALFKRPHRQVLARVSEQLPLLAIDGSQILKI